MVYVGGNSQSNNRSSSGTAQPSGGSSVSPALKMFFFSVGFAALGTFVGWLVGRRIRKSVPRVDYVILSEQDKDRAERSPDQYLADLMTLPAGDQAAESLLPGSSFDSQRSATLFSQFGSAGTPVRLNGSMNATITTSDARTYRLFPTVRNFEQAMIVSCGDTRERTGSECRYLAVVTRKVGGEPLVSLQRLSPRDIVRMSTQINLIQAGILP